MNRSRWTVVIILAVVVAGTTAWSWVNLFHSPDYDPRKAHLFLEHFYARCSTAHDATVCDPVVGQDHRRCFSEHLVYVDPDEDSRGPIIYDRRLYLECMNEGVQRELGSGGS